jgi:hypothetical protein
MLKESKKSGMVPYHVIYDELFADCLFLQIRQKAQTGFKYAPDSLFLATKR